MTDRMKVKIGIILSPSSRHLFPNLPVEESPLFILPLDRNPCTLQSTFNIGKLTKINVAEDIIQSVLTNLEAFAISKVKALFVLTLPSQFLWLYLHSRMRLLYNNHGYPPKIHILAPIFLLLNGSQ